MKIVIAPQSFKGSLSAWEVAVAIDEGIKRVLSDVETELLPMADGGEGTAEALIKGTGGRFLTAEVTGPLGGKLNAHWGILGDGITAVIEMAAASGITLVPEEELNPLLATTYGTGELIQAALDAGCRRLIIAIGGSATNDGGAGMAQALGAKMLDESGQQLPPGGLALGKLKRIDISEIDQRLKESEVIVACDVSNPLCGEQGASKIYGPQKGATSEMCQQLDEALDNYSRVIKQDMALDVKDIPGAGAAGGLGAGLIAFLGAKLVPGIAMVSQAIGLAEHLEGASLVITGEGRIDGQTLFGKSVTGVAQEAGRVSVPVVAIAGEVAGDFRELPHYGIAAAVSIAPGPVSRAESMADARRLVANAAEQVFRLIMIDLPR